MASPHASSAPSTSLGVAPSSSIACTSSRYASSMRLPMKPKHTPDTTPTLPMRLATAIAVASASLRRRLAAHDLQQPHDVGRRKEVHAEHVARTLGRCRDGIHVERRRVGRQHRAGLRDRVELAEDLLLERQLLEHRLDDEIGSPPASSNSRLGVKLAMRRLPSSAEMRPLDDVALDRLAHAHRRPYRAPPAPFRRSSPECLH